MKIVIEPHQMPTRYGPCVTVLAQTGPGGPPIGVPVVGPRFGDQATLGAAEWIRRALA